MVDDGSGKVEVWRIEDFADVAIEPAMHGQFFAGDSYIVQYTYLEGNKQAYILYFWLGSKSSQDEKGAAALLTKQKDDALGGAATQVRVVQGQEPSHFVRLFKGHMVVHSGGKASGFSGGDADFYDTDGVSLFHVKGSDEFSTKAAQVEETCDKLNSGDCFVLLSPGSVQLWMGEFSSEAEVSVARTITGAMKGGRALVELKEGEEDVRTAPPPCITPSRPPATPPPAPRHPFRTPPTPLASTPSSQPEPPLPSPQEVDQTPFQPQPEPALLTRAPARTLEPPTTRPPAHPTSRPRAGRLLVAAGRQG